MSRPPRIVAFSGSARRESLNARLVRVAAADAEAAGADVQLVDLADYPMPLYDGDLEKDSGLPKAARDLKALMRDSDGLLIASPEYNSSITPLLKNTIDWVSRAESKDEPGLVAYRGKVAALLSASPGGLGGLRGLVHLRAILGNIGMHVIPQQRALSRAGSAFDETGALVNDADRASVRTVAVSLVDCARRLMQ